MKPPREKPHRVVLPVVPCCPAPSTGVECVDLLGVLERLNLLGPGRVLGSHCDEFPDEVRLELLDGAFGVRGGRPVQILVETSDGDAEEEAAPIASV